jgi:D-alanyl-D-alanine carboxypeptidase (penicillin-binding protein 5/6)
MFIPLVNAEETSSTTDLAPNAKSAIMIEATTGNIIFEKNSNEELPMASMTKMMTMLLIMEAIDNGSLTLDEKVTASEYASSMGGSQIFLEPGESMTVDDLLKGIAIGSGNDVAVAKKQS